MSIVAGVLISVNKEIQSSSNTHLLYFFIVNVIPVSYQEKFPLYDTGPNPPAAKTSPTRRSREMVPYR